jgi:hypothetical protein
MEKQNRKRNIQLVFRVTRKEKDLIQEKMRLLHTDNFNDYARRMATRGYIITQDVSDLKAQAAELQKITVNINQIFRKVKQSNSLYDVDIAGLQEKMRGLWHLERQLFRERTVTEQPPKKQYSQGIKKRF